MLIYSSSELHRLNRVLTLPPRSVRKQLFKLRLWLPVKCRQHVFSSRVNDAAAHTVESRAESRDADDLITQRSKCKQFLKFATYNVRSLGNKFSSVSEFITDNKLDLVAVTETWHLSQDDVSVRRSIPPGHRIVDVPRAHSVDTDPTRLRGGGIILYLRDHFVVKSVGVIVQRSTFELLSVSLSTPRGPIVIVVVYRPGSAPPDSAFFR